MLMFHSFSLMEEANALSGPSHIPPASHTRCLKCGRSKKFICSTSLSSVLPCNKSHLSIWKQERPSESLLYPSGVSLLHSGAIYSLSSHYHGDLFLPSSIAFLFKTNPTWCSYPVRPPLPHKRGAHLSALATFRTSVPYHAWGSLSTLAL